MSTYLDQSATNPDLSSNGTPRAPRWEFQLFNLGGGPSKKLDEETLETRVRGPSKKLDEETLETRVRPSKNLDEETLETRVRQRSGLKRLILAPGTLLAAGAAHPCTWRGGCRPRRR